ncbi:hypothetical protein QUF80_16590 [Desulfococcaceae bacterium HSG8]|nr:hypothetical protein [Desulfococcaceae bacterium HSG8]
MSIINYPLSIEPAPPVVGWVERSVTHHYSICNDGGLRFASPTLQLLAGIDKSPACAGFGFANPNRAIW